MTVEVTGPMIHDYKGHFETLFKKIVTKDKVKFKITGYKRFHFTSGDKLHVYASKSMSGLVETAFSIVKPNVVPTFPTAPYSVSQLWTTSTASRSYLPEERMMMKGRMISDFHHTCITCDLPIPVHNLYYIMCMLR